jgi:hypothetical protein
MDWQSAINLIVGVLLSIIGWFARQLWESVQKLKDDLKKIEVDLPTHYVRKIDLESRLDRLEATLDKIFDKLENKADK